MKTNDRFAVYVRWSGLLRPGPQIFSDATFRLGADCKEGATRFAYLMSHNHDLKSDDEQQESQNIRERLQSLQEKASRLNETLDRVEETLKGAAGESDE
jgi:predicted nuclease with TOPRIM domain